MIDCSTIWAAREPLPRTERLSVGAYPRAARTIALAAATRCLALLEFPLMMSTMVILPRRQSSSSIRSSMSAAGQIGPRSNAALNAWFLRWRLSNHFGSLPTRRAASAFESHEVYIQRYRRSSRVNWFHKCSRSSCVNVIAVGHSGPQRWERLSLEAELASEGQTTDF